MSFSAPSQGLEQTMEIAQQDTDIKHSIVVFIATHGGLDITEFCAAHKDSTVEEVIEAYNSILCTQFVNRGDKVLVSLYDSLVAEHGFGEVNRSLEVCYRKLRNELKKSKPKKVVKLKDPNAPQKPRTAYQFFCSEVQEKIRTELQTRDGNCKQMGQELSRLWQEMKAASGFHRAARCAASDPNDPRRDWMMKAWPHDAENEVHHNNLERYKQLAVADKNRYQIEMMNYIEPTQQELQDKLIAY